MNELPLFVCDKIEQNRDRSGELVVSFKCPCGRRHWHGWLKSDPPGTPQHRVAHCAKPVFEAGYFIVLEAAR